MAPKRTWLWVLLGVLGFSFVVLIAAAGAGVYFVTRHFHTESVSDAGAIRAFEAVRREFQGDRPLYQMDAAEQPHLSRPLAEIPTSPRRPASFNVLAWEPDRHHLVRITLPLWVLGLGHQHNMVVGNDARGFDLQRLELDPDELARIGPALIFDFRNRDDVRVLVWTE